jgi:hypothetical protein
MKSLQALIISAIVAASFASNEHVASRITAIERELVEFEHQLETRTSGVSLPSVVALEDIDCLMSLLKLI